MCPNNRSQSATISYTTFEPEEKSASHDAAGGKKTVIFLHGARSSSSVWTGPSSEAVQDMTLAGHRAIAVDLPGHGNSTAISSLADKGDFLKRLVQTVSPETKPVLVAHSFAGTYAVPMVADNPKDNGETCRAYAYAL